MKTSAPPAVDGVASGTSAAAVGGAASAGGTSSPGDEHWKATKRRGGSPAGHARFGFSDVEPSSGKLPAGTRRG